MNSITGYQEDMVAERWYYNKNQAFIKVQSSNQDKHLLIKMVVNDSTG